MKSEMKTVMPIYRFLLGKEKERAVMKSCTRVPKSNLVRIRILLFDDPNKMKEYYHDHQKFDIYLEPGLTYAIHESVEKEMWAHP